MVVARQILLTDGPGGLTLQGVAAAAGMAHGNITHHFGSIGNLQAELADALIGELVEAVRVGVVDLRCGVIDERELVDLVFDRFENTGIGRLFGWLAAQAHPQLSSLYEKFQLLLANLESEEAGDSSLRSGELPGVISTVLIAALGASLIGRDLASALKLPSTFTRSTIASGLIERRAAGKTGD